MRSFTLNPTFAFTGTHKKVRFVFLECDMPNQSDMYPKQILPKTRRSFEAHKNQPQNFMKRKHKVGNSESKEEVTIIPLQNTPLGGYPRYF